MEEEQHSAITNTAWPKSHHFNKANVSENCCMFSIVMCPEGSADLTVNMLNILHKLYFHHWRTGERTGEKQLHKLVSCISMTNVYLFQTTCNKLGTAV